MFRELQLYIKVKCIKTEDSKLLIAFVIILNADDVVTF